jgi:hypothetical protein
MLNVATMKYVVTAAKEIPGMDADVMGLVSDEINGSGSVEFVYV